MAATEFDHRVRILLFEWLDQQVDVHGEVLPFDILSQRFRVEGERVPLLGPQGIFKPRILDLPLSITTAPNGPYDDAFGNDGHLRYRYRGADPRHRDNVGLRECMRSNRPLVYFHGIAKGQYLAAWPTFIIGDDPANLTFTVAVDDAQHLGEGLTDFVGEPTTDIRRKYVTSTVRRRMHQAAFRERVLAAYRRQCALCRLRHVELLEAAHILPDSSPEGEPVVRNGLALCNLHHAAFDRQILGIRPDYVVEVRLAILREIDGPMLKHGIQGMHGSRIEIPRRLEDRPDPDLLSVRCEAFRESA